MRHGVWRRLLFLPQPAQLIGRVSNRTLLSNDALFRIGEACDTTPDRRAFSGVVHLGRFIAFPNSPSGGEDAMEHDGPNMDEAL